VTIAHRLVNLLICDRSLWLSATTATDMALAAGLVWRLRSIETSFRSTQTCVLPLSGFYPYLLAVGRLLSKLSSSALQSGFVTSAIALIVLCTFLVNNESNSMHHPLITITSHLTIMFAVPVAVNFFLGKSLLLRLSVYPITNCT
jgi:hypothetical protein